jgi:hypothetical protein
LFELQHPDVDQARNPLVTVSGGMTQLDVAFLMIDRRRGNQFHPYTSGPVDAVASTASCLVIIGQFGVFCCNPPAKPRLEMRGLVRRALFGERPLGQALSPGGSWTPFAPNGEMGAKQKDTARGATNEQGSGPSVPSCYHHDRRSGARPSCNNRCASRCLCTLRLRSK